MRVPRETSSVICISRFHCVFLWGTACLHSLFLNPSYIMECPYLHIQVFTNCKYRPVIH